MGLNLSGLQIARELDINKDDGRAMISQLRQGIVDRRPPVVLEGEVECDEVYVVAGHNHAAGEYARDDDGDGFREVHVNTMEGFWSLLRSWLRPHRGIPRESLPLYLGFFEFVHNVRARDRRLPGALIGQLSAPPCKPS
jgi:hypothetical protein